MSRYFRFTRDACRRRHKMFYSHTQPTVKNATGQQPSQLRVFYEYFFLVYITHVYILLTTTVPKLSEKMQIASRDNSAFSSNILSVLGTFFICYIFCIQTVILKLNWSYCFKNNYCFTPRDFIHLSCYWTIWYISWSFRAGERTSW